MSGRSAACLRWTCAWRPRTSATSSARQTTSPTWRAARRRAPETPSSGSNWPLNTWVRTTREFNQPITAHYRRPSWSIPTILRSWRFRLLHFIGYIGLVYFMECLFFIKIIFKGKINNHGTVWIKYQIYSLEETRNRAFDAISTYPGHIKVKRKCVCICEQLYDIVWYF